jgi:two-component system heavy metal sensor histidine kinase CusS
VGGTLVTVLGVIGCASFYLNFSLARLFQKEGNRELVEKADLVMDRLDLAPWPDDVPEPPDEDGRTIAPPEFHLDPDVLMDTENLQVRIVGHDGKILLESQGLSRLMPQASMPKLGTWTWQDVDGPTGAQFLVYSRPFDHGWILTAWDIRYENRLLKKSQDLLYLTWGLATLLTGLFTVLFTRRGLAPLKLLAEKAEAIRPGALRLELDSASLPRELEPLAEKLQSALARLDEAFSRLTTLNADVAHELRTPLHGIRLEVEGLLRDAQLSPADQERVEGLMETLDYLAATLDQMLFLARAEDPGMALHPAPLDVGGLLASAAAPFASLAEEKGIPLDTKAPEGLTLQADELLVRRALHNLLANALRHTPADRAVRVEGLLEDGSVVLQVRDEGEGMPEAFLSRIGMRFQRPDSSRTRASGGAGLGLAIVGSIMRLHGGTLEIQSAPGKGTLARLRFPG